MQTKTWILQDFPHGTENPIEFSACAAEQKSANGWFLTISTFSERRVFLKNHSIEFHKIWQGNTSGSGQVKDLKCFEI